MYIEYPWTGSEEEKLTETELGTFNYHQKSLCTPAHEDMIKNKRGDYIFYNEMFYRVEREF